MVKSKRKRSRPPGPPPETRTAEVATVGWMLLTMTALVSELLTTLGKWYVRVQPDAELVRGLAELLFFAALVTGVMSLIAAAVVFRLRKTRPPTAITVIAIAVGVAPLAAIAWQLLF